MLQDETESIIQMIEDLTRRIEALQNKLMAKARHNVRKRNRLKNLFKVFKAVANVIPVIGPTSSAITSGVSAAFSLANSISFSNVSSAISNIQTSPYTATITKSVSTVSKNVEKLISSANNLQSVISGMSASNAEVQAEYNKLLAQSAQWKGMMEQVEDLNNRKTELLNHMEEVFVDMTTKASELSNDVLALDALKQQSFTGNSKRDLNAMLHLENMEQRAKSRLQLYDYYLRKAYEYRLLKPYEGEEFNLVGMFERFEKLGLALDSVVNQKAYSALGSVFKEVISNMTERIVKEYSVNLPEQSTSSAIIIPKEQLDVINVGDALTLNFHEMGIFPADRENVRIVDIDILHIDSHVKGNIGYSGGMELNLKHSGTSTFRKDGNLYWFNHKTGSTTNPHTWGVSYDAVSGTTEAIRPSAANTSLLSSLVGIGTDIMLFSRPSAWSDIAVSKNVHTAGGADIVIDSLVLRLKYDFTRRPDNIRNIDISTSEGWLPYIACSTEDINGRSNGNGRLYRSYRNGSQSVTFSAVDKYETYQFKNWTDQAGNVVSSKNELTVATSRDQFYMANYERHIPVLDIPDTLRVSHEGGIYVVRVSNRGLGDKEMDWEVSDSLSTWVHLDGDATGVDDGSFIFTFETNNTASTRLDSLEIFAPETDEMSKVIYIVQESDMNQYANLLYVANIEALPGQHVKLPVLLRNNVDVARVSLTLDLPKGVTLLTDEDDDIVCSLNNERVRSSKFSVYSARLAEGSYGIRIMPTSTATISDREGTILEVIAEVSATMPKGEYELALRNNSLTVRNNVEGLSTLALPDTRAMLSVGDALLANHRR